MSGIFDSHAHYDDEAFAGDREDVLASLPSAGIEYVVNVGASRGSTFRSVKLASEYEYIYASVGIHPAEVYYEDGDGRRVAVTDADWDWMEEQALHNPKVVAIGECGFDYHWLPSKDEDLAAIYENDEAMKAMQREAFARQIAMAKRVKKPIIVHSREAAFDTYSLMTSEGARDCGGVIHCFSYSVEEAKKYLDLGFYIGIGGVLTFKNAGKLAKVCEYVPMDRILLETDCPYMAPEPHRGSRNDSRYLPHVVRKMAELKGLTTREVVEATRANAMRMYGIAEGSC